VRHALEDSNPYRPALEAGALTVGPRTYVRVNHLGFGPRTKRLRVSYSAVELVVHETEVPARIELAMAGLQSAPLPLGEGTTVP
jgi:hypothetical protein